MKMRRLEQYLFWQEGWERSFRQGWFTLWVDASRLFGIPTYLYFSVYPAFTAWYLIESHFDGGSELETFFIAASFVFAFIFLAACMERLRLFQEEREILRRYARTGSSELAKAVDSMLKSYISSLPIEVDESEKWKYEHRVARIVELVGRRPDRSDIGNDGLTQLRFESIRHDDRNNQ